MTHDRIKEKAHIVRHILNKVDYAQLLKEEYGSIKANIHNEEHRYLVCNQGKYTINSARFTDAISKAITLHFIFHVTYPKQAAANYKLLAVFFGMSYKQTILRKKPEAKK